MELNDILQWAAFGVTLILGLAGLYLQHLALKVAREDLAITKQQLSIEQQKHSHNTHAELRRIALEEQKLAERKAAREQKALGAVVRWMLRDS